MTKLSNHQETVLAAFDKKNADISISLLFMRVYGHDEWQRKGNTNRTMQQKLAPTFKEINNKIKHGRIEVGFTKGTYRLNTKGE